MLDFTKIEGFEWNDGNRDKNWIAHQVEWTEAEEAFLNTPILVSPDSKHSISESRMVLLGRTLADRRLVIVFTVRSNRIRVISARDMSKKEGKHYDEALEEDS